jgi:hypothetical protein
MQHLESAAPPATRPSSARWMRVSAAVVLCLAGPAVSFAGVLTTGLSGTAAAVRFPASYGVTLVATAAATVLAAVLAALIARRDALVAIPVSLGIWFAVGVGASIAGLELSHSGLAYWGVAVIVASVAGAAVGMLLAVRRGQAQDSPSSADHT